jgi:type II restriction enzyme
VERDFDKWLSSFRESISDYGYYVDFEKVYESVDKFRIELNILNSLIGSNSIKDDFESLAARYPETLKAIPSLLAVRQREIFAMDADGAVIYDFKNYADDIGKYSTFMEKTGLFNLISNHIINNLIDYVTGVEAGLSSNGRKNRGGHLMENLVEGYIKATGAEYYKEMYAADIEKKWGIDLGPLLNDGKTKKRFDFVVRVGSHVYAIETNFYSGYGGGSKLNETARSYKLLAQESEEIEDFTFVWLTDGTAWNSAKGNLRETFDTTKYVYSIIDLEDGVLDDLFKD